jgi:polyisoprenoid-binding protein YceI
MTMHIANDITTLTGSWVLDSTQTTIRFKTKTMWVVTVEGTFTALEGRATVAPDGTVNGLLVIDMASVNTKNARIDNHLRGPDFFDVERHPTMTFTTTSGRMTSPGRAELTGQLLIRGKFRPLTLLSDVATGDNSVTVTTEADLDRSDWDISLVRGPGKRRSLQNRVVVSARFDRESSR